MRLGFEFYVGSLENAIMNLLRDGDSTLKLPGLKELGAKDIAPYSGELDAEKVLDALKAQINRFPLVLASYGGGANKRKTAVNLLDGDSIEEEHECSFVVVVIAGDLRGETARRRGGVDTLGIYTMIDAVTNLLGGVTFDADFIDENGTVRREPLNHQPFLPFNVEAIINRPDVTAYAVPFVTSFKYSLPDRRTVFAGTANEILLGGIPTNNPQGQPQGQETVATPETGASLPGVFSKR